MKKPKLLLLTQTVHKTDPILGFFHAWIEAFAKDFAEVHVICLYEGEHQLPANVTVYSLGKEAGVSRLKYLYNFYRYFYHIFVHVRVDYVFFHMGAIYNVLATPFFLLRRRYATRFMWWKAHGHINWLGTLALWCVDEVVTSTKSGFSIDTDKRRVVGQAIDTETFFYESHEARDPMRVLYVGRLMSVKQLEVFIDTARLLEPQGYTFEIIGPVGDDAYVSALKQRAADTNVIWSGPKTQTELVTLYQQASVFLNPSQTHSMDKTVLEAMLCGCVPLTANRAFVQLLEPYGLYVTEQSAQKYATLISALGSRDTTTLRQDLSHAVVEAHSLNTFSERIFGLQNTI